MYINVFDGGNSMVREEKDVKIFLGRSPFGWLDRRTAKLLQEKVQNRSQWIRDMAMDEFGYDLKGVEDFSEFDALLKNNHYKDKNDWLRDIARRTLKK